MTEATAPEASATKVGDVYEQILFDSIFMFLEGIAGKHISFSLKSEDADGKLESEMTLSYFTTAEAVADSKAKVLKLRNPAKPDAAAA